MEIPEHAIKAGAAAIANARAARRGVPAVANVLLLLEGSFPKLHREVMEDAKACLEAAREARL